MKYTKRRLSDSTAQWGPWLASSPANVLKITNTGGYDEDTSMNQVIRGIDIEVQPLLGRIVTLCYRASTSYQTR